MVEQQKHLHSSLHVYLYSDCSLLLLFKKLISLLMHLVNFFYLETPTAVETTQAADSRLPGELRYKIELKRFSSHCWNFYDLQMFTSSAKQSLTVINWILHIPVSSTTVCCTYWCPEACVWALWLMVSLFTVIPDWEPFWRQNHVHVVFTLTMGTLTMPKKNHWYCLI